MNLIMKKNIETFRKLVDRYKTGKTENDSMIELKFEHTLNVLDNAERILTRERITEHLELLCKVAALYHDIGRFPQIYHFGTFRDEDSINHARLGILTMRENDLPIGLNSTDCKKIRIAVGLHNAKEVRTSIGEDLSTIVNVVRDADKLDICKVMSNNLTADNSHRPIIFQGVQDVPTKYTEEVYNCIMSKQNASYNEMKYINDFILLLIGWINDLKYSSSKSLLFQSGVLEHYFSLLPDNDEIQVLKMSVQSWIDDDVVKTI